MIVLAVIVLYKRSPAQSKTLVSLGEAFARHPELLEFLRVLLWDNSPRALANPTLAFPCEYIQSDKNNGNAGAYNRAMEIAEDRGIPWLLLLDQDTTISEEFLPKMMRYADRVTEDSEIAAVIPLLWCRGQLISPKRLAGFYRILPVPPSCHGIYREQVFAADSGALMRVTALRGTGGYNEDLFWLDFSDIYVFAGLHRNRRSIYIADDVQLQHSLACMDYDNDMTPERYRNFLAAEGAFLGLYRSALDNIALTVRLLARAIKYLRYKNKAYAKMSWKAFCRRVLVSKARLMEGWKEQLRQRNLPSVSASLVACSGDQPSPGISLE